MRTKENIVLYVGFLFFAQWLLYGYNGELLRKLLWDSCFWSNSLFFNEQVSQTGGLLIYVGRFLTQTLCRPFGGALLLSGSLTLIAWIWGKICGFRGILTPLSFLPSLLFLWVITSVGYGYYMVVDNAYPFIGVVGLLAALLIFVLYRLIGERTGLMALYVMFVCATIPFLSFFSYIALGMMVVDVWRRRSSLRWFVTGVALFVPLLYVVWGGRMLFDECFALSIGALLPSSMMGGQLVAMLLIGLLLPVGVLLRPVWGRVPYFGSKSLISSLLVLSLLCGGVFFFSCRDANFRDELRVRNLADDMQWNKILKVYASSENPSEVLNAYRIIALANTSSLDKGLFAGRLRHESPHADLYLPERIYQEDLFFYASFFNTSYMWSMEAWTSNSPSYRRALNMIRCALLNDEDALAKKLIDLMKQSFAMRSVVNEMESFLSDKEKMFQKYPLYRRLVENRPMMDQPQYAMDPLPKYYMYYNAFSPENVERRLYADLYLRKMNWLARDLLSASRLMPVLPTPVQEAVAILVVDGADPSILSRYRVNKNISDKVFAFFGALRNYPVSKRDEAERWLYGVYGGMYCYYYVFSDRMGNQDGK